MSRRTRRTRRTESAESSASVESRTASDGGPASPTSPGGSNGSEISDSKASRQRRSREGQAAIKRLGAPVRTRLRIGQVLVLLSGILAVAPYLALVRLGDILLDAYNAGAAPDPQRVRTVVMMLISAYSTRLLLYMVALIITHMADLSLREALRLDPSYDQALARLAILRMRRGDQTGAARALASFAAQNPRSSIVRTVVDLFLAQVVSVIHTGTILCLLLMLVALLLMRFAGLPAVIAVLVLLVMAMLTGIWAHQRIQALRSALPDRGRRIAWSFVRRRRLIVVWALLLAAIWAGLAIGISLLLAGNGAAPWWTTVSGFVATLIGWRLSHIEFDDELE